MEATGFDHLYTVIWFSSDLAAILEVGRDSLPSAPMNYILEDKKPVPEENYRKWLDWMNTADLKVKHDRLPDGTEVSTVFLGVGKPHRLFQTIVAGGKYNGHLRHYATWEQAEAGHQETIEMIFG